MKRISYSIVMSNIISSPSSPNQPYVNEYHPSLSTPPLYPLTLYSVSQLFIYEYANPL